MTQENNISISKIAADKINNIIASENKDLMLKISVLGGGCAGFSYKFDLVSNTEKGDIVIVRTGRWFEKSIKGDSDYSKVSAGVDYKIASLLYERQVSVLGSDGTNDAQPSGIPEEGSPVHKLTLVSMGMPLLDNLDLEHVSKEAKKQNKWEFFISVQPLRFKGGTGSPVNAIALF